MVDTTFLFEVSPIKPDGTTETLWLCSKGSSKGTVYLDGKQWLPLIETPPDFDFRIVSGGQLTYANVSYGSIEFICSDVFGNEQWSAYDWTEVQGRCWYGPDGAPWSEFAQVFEGKVSGFTKSNIYGKVELLGAEADTQTPALYKKYLGIGGAEGGLGIKGNLKPRAHGFCRNVNLEPIDFVNMVYQVHGYGAIKSIPALYEFGQALAPATGDVATYAQLIALNLAPAQWATCNAEGLIRLGGQPSKKLTCDIEGAVSNGVYVATAGQIIKQIISEANPAARFGTFPACFDTEWCFYGDADTSVREIAYQAAFDVGGYIYPDGLGIWQAGDFYAPVNKGELRSDRSSPIQVINHEELQSTGPISLVSVGHTRVWSTHTTDELSKAVLTDLAAEMQAAAEVAEAARLAAEFAAAQAAVAIARLTNMSADGLLARDEKSAMLADYQAIIAERARIVGQATALNLIVERDAYTGSITALTSYLTGMTPPYNDLNQVTPVNPAEFVAKFAAVYNSRQTLLNAIVVKTRMAVNWDSITGPGKPDDYADVTGDNTSKDTNAVGGKPATQLLNALDELDRLAAIAAAAIAKAESDIAALQTSASTDLAALQGQLNTVKQETADIQQAAAQTRQDVLNNATEINTVSSTVGTQGTAITTLQTAAEGVAGKIATLQQSVVAGNPNLLINPTFVEGMAGWYFGAGTMDGTSPYTYYNTTWGSSFSLAGLGSGKTGYCYIEQKLLATPAHPYTATADFDSTGLCHVELLWLGADNVELHNTRLYSDTLVDPWFGNGPANRLKAQVSGLAPAGTVYALVRIVFRDDGAPLTYAATRQVKFETGLTATSFRDDAAVRTTYEAISTNNTKIASLESVVEVQGASITSNAKAINDANGKVATLETTVGTQGTAISSLATASSTQAGQLAQLKLGVSALSVNLIKNGSFEAGDFSDWNVVGQGWTVAKSGPWGSFAFTNTNTADGSFTYLETYQATIEGPDWYTFTADVGHFQSGQGLHYCEIVWWDANRNFISQVGGNARQAGNNFDPTSANRTDLAVSALSPAGAVYASGRAVFRKDNGTVQSFHVRQAKFERGKFPTAYSAEASIGQTFTALSSQAGTLASLETTVGTQGSTINTQAQAISGLNTDLASLSTTVSTQGSSISTQATAITSLQGKTATLETKVSSGNPNLVPNGGFENKLDGWIGQGAWGWERNTWGNYAYNNQNGTNILYSPWFGVEANAQFTVAGDPTIIAGDGWVFLDLEFQDGNNNTVGYGNNSRVYPTRGFATDNGGRDAIKATTTAPGNAVRARVRFVAENISGIGVVAIRQIKCERGAIATAYSNEATVTSNYTTLSSLNGSYASLSSSIDTRFGETSTRIGDVSKSLSDATGAVASRTSTLEGSLWNEGGINARLTQTSQVAAVAADRTSGARWSLEARSNTGRAQLTVYSFDGNGNPQSGVDIIGDLAIHGNLTIDGTLTTGKMASNAAQSVQWARTSGQQTLGYNQWTRIIQLGFNKSVWESSIDLYANLRMRSGDDITGQFRLVNLNNGAVEDSWPIWMVGVNNLYQVPISLNWIASGWAPGGYTLAIDYLSSENDAQTFSEAGSIIKIHEIKR